MGKDATYEIDLVQLKDNAPAEYRYHIGKDFFEERDNVDIVNSDVDVTLRIEKTHGSYKIEMDFDGTIWSPCDRCLEAVELPIEEEYDVIVRHGEEYDDSGDGALVIPESWTRLDVSGLIYDTLLLSIPLRCVHPEGECDKGMQERLREHSDSAEE